MRIAYFDLVAGASGDMLLASLLDAGLQLDELRNALGALKLREFDLIVERVMRGHFAATRVDVRVADDVPARHLHHIEAVIRESDLDPAVQDKALSIFRRMIRAEARLHGRPEDEVHLHELGAVDTIVDVCGFLLGCRLLGIERIYCSPVPLGRGTLHGSHGHMPLPAPATLALLEGASVYGVDAPFETVTPTAAALLTSSAESFGPIPPMRLETTGVGAGGRTEPEPNILRLLLGQADPSLPVEQLLLLETNLDDVTPEIEGYVLDRLLAAGALDVYYTPILMKKGRPASLLGVLCRPADAPDLRSILFRETTTLGVRSTHMDRHALPRRIEDVPTPYGAIRVKIATFEGRDRAAPEYDDCRAAAESAGVPLLDVYRAALRAWDARVTIPSEP